MYRSQNVIEKDLYKRNETLSRGIVEKRSP